MLAFETSPGWAFDVAVGASVDSLERLGVSTSAALRLERIGGLYARWDVYRGVSGTNFVAGLEVNDAPGVAGALGVLGAIAIGALAVAISRACDEPGECELPPDDQ